MFLLVLLLSITFFWTLIVILSKNKSNKKSTKIIESTELPIDEIQTEQSINSKKESSKIEITREFAESLLSKRAIVTEAGVFGDPITVSNVSFGKIDPKTKEIKEKFYWKNADGTPNLKKPYADVYLQAMTEAQFARAEELLEEGRFSDAVGKEAGYISLRMNAEDVISAGLTRGSVVQCTFKYVRDLKGNDIFRCTAIAPMIARDGVNRFKEARLKAQKIKVEELKSKVDYEELIEDELDTKHRTDNKSQKYKEIPRYEDMNENEQMRYKALQRAIKTFKENYEQSNTEKIIITNSLLFTNYSSNYQKTNSYPIVRIPKLGTIIRSYQIGRAQKRGFKEEIFQKSLEKYFGTEFTILGNARINTGKQTRPYEPDIAMIDSTNSNLRIDIEIDEPYAGITRQPTHCENEDNIRDLYFTDRGWLVIRFSEYQVHNQELECVRLIADVIKLVNPKYSIPESLKNILKIKDEKFWDILQAQKWEKINYREQYLNHTFRFISEKSEKFISDLTNHEQTEESLVKSTYIGNVDRSLATGFNLKNKHLRDEIIKFYPESHNYTISNVQAISVSTIISKFFPEFDSYAAAGKLNPNHKLYNFTIDEIVEIWKKQGEESARKGTFLHKQIENYYLEKKFEETPELHLFKDFINENSTLEPYRTEWKIFDEQYNIAGTIDLIAKKGADLEIYDWKRSRKIVKAYTGELIKENKWQKGIGQLSEIEDTSYNRYCLQQSLYKYILEKNYDLKISNMYLIVLHPNYHTYYKVKVPYLKSEIEYILKSM